MKFGFVKCGAYTPKINVADVEYNAQNIKQGITNAKKEGVELLVFPELCLTGCSCGDLFYSQVLLDGAKKALRDIALFCSDYNGVVLLGLPIKHLNNIYNTCAVINSGKVLAFVVNNCVNNSGYINFGRFATLQNPDQVDFYGEKVILATNVIFKDSLEERFSFGIDFYSGITSVYQKSVLDALNGATIIACLGGANQTVGKREYDLRVINDLSSRAVCGLVYAECGEGETTQDMAFAGHNVISENGKTLKESKLWSTGLIATDIDLDGILYNRSKAFNNAPICQQNYQIVSFNANTQNEKLKREFLQYPFLPSDISEMPERARLILDIQSEGLKKRISHTHAGCVVLGLSGGLDSTLAIIVAVMAMKKLGRPCKDVVAVTMPCFGTTGRTLNNSIKLAKALGATLKKVDITKSVLRHLKDIKHNGELNVTYENAQARERTQVLMDIANMSNGLVVGTGDLSELALGWATYNGDHMSMYGVNGALPKTLIRHVVTEYAKLSKPKLKAVLFDILDTPVSPELLPAKEGEISQKTEDIVGPYTLHDFYLYNMIARGWSPKKIYFVAKNTFKGVYDEATILKWLKTFIRRFFTQQFKRSCLPDGIKVGSVGLSPRSEWKMPSDAVSSIWLKELENL
jgi:NAD+ synthase (glutamine-hydrolysing)